MWGYPQETTRNESEREMKSSLEKWKLTARRLNTEVYALYLAYRDPRTPLYARVFTACVVGYAFSPIDLIPDFIPILGYLDDLLLIPIGIKVAVGMIPSEVMKDCREKANHLFPDGKPVSWVAAVVVVLVWLVLAALVVWKILQVVQPYF